MSVTSWCARLGVAALLFVSLSLAAALTLPSVSARGQARPAMHRWKLVQVTREMDGLEVLMSGVQHARRLARSPSDCPTISPDGRMVAFFTRRGLSVVDTRGGVARRVAAAPRASAKQMDGCRAFGTYRLAWSRDSRQLAFSFAGACPPGAGQCLNGTFIVRPDGSGLRRLAPDAASAFSWSPDDRQLAATVGGKSLVVFTTTGSGRRVLGRPGDSRLGAPAWSEDGLLIALGRNCSEAHPGPGGGDLMCDMAVVAANGTGARTLVRRDGASGPYADAPAWLSTGELLLSQAYKRAGIYAIDPRTGASRKVGKDLGQVLTAGPGGTFAYLAFDLIIADKTGHVLAHHAVSRPMLGMASIWLD